MTNLGRVVWSSVGKKTISGITGLILVLFLVVHLIGNLLIYVGPDAFNSYAHTLEKLGHGFFIYMAEAGLLAFFALHIGSGISVALRRRSARKVAYYKVTDAGGNSRKSLASRSMVVTGVVIFLFVVIHVKMFKFGPAQIVRTAHGADVRDLYTLVLQSFNNPVISLFYTAAMILLGVHLRHGVWSAFQSLGVNHPRLNVLIYIGGTILGILLAIGFVLFPVMILFFFENPVVRGGI